MRTILIGAMFWAASTVAIAWEDWNQEKKNLFVASNIAIIVDWGQTLDLSERYNEGFYETNRWLGRYPDRGDINRYMAGRLISNYLLAEYLPEPWDQFSLWFSIGAHGSAAINNHNIGLEFRF